MYFHEGKSTGKLCERQAWPTRTVSRSRLENPHIGSKSVLFPRTGIPDSLIHKNPRFPR
jgi:hypothetical protein